MHEPNNKIHNLCRLLLPLVLAFAAGSALTGLFLHRQRLTAITELNYRYAAEHRSARDAIANLETELGRERAINRELRAHNSRARTLVTGLTETSGRTIRNLQEAGGLIGEIRQKLKVLENFYTNSDTGNSGN